MILGAWQDQLSAVYMKQTWLIFWFWLRKWSAVQLPSPPRFACYCVMIAFLKTIIFLLHGDQRWVWFFKIKFTYNQSSSSLRAFAWAVASHWSPHDSSFALGLCLNVLWHCSHPTPLRRLHFTALIGWQGAQSCRILQGTRLPPPAHPVPSPPDQLASLFFLSLKILITVKYVTKFTIVTI